MQPDSYRRYQIINLNQETEYYYAKEKETAIGKAYRQTKTNRAEA